MVITRPCAGPTTGREQRATMVQFSDEVLEETPPKVTTLLLASNAVPIICTALAKAGITAARLQHGCELLLACIAQPIPGVVPVDTEAAAAKRQAVAEIDAADEPVFARCRAPLEHNYASACEYLFQDLTASQGPQSVRGMATFLARVSALESGTDPQRAASREQDRKAIEVLAERGFDKAWRSRMDEKVKMALAPAPPLPDLEPPDPAERRRRLTELKVWFDDVAGTARAVITKRSHLIRMGLAHRRPSKPAEPEPA